MGKSWMRGLGAGLMEVGNQVELSRKERMEQQREANLMKIAADRDAIAREQMTQSGAQFDKTMTFNTEQAKLEAGHRAAVLKGQQADSAADAEFRLQSLKFQNEERARAAQERGDTRAFQKATLYGQNFDRFEKATAQAVKDLYGETGMTKEQYELLVAGLEATGDAESARAAAAGLDPKLGLGVRAPEQEKIDQLKAGLQDAWKLYMGPDAGEFDAGKFLGMYPSTFVGSAEDQAAALKIATDAAAAAAAPAGEEGGPVYDSTGRLDSELEAGSYALGGSSTGAYDTPSGAYGGMAPGKTIPAALMGDAVFGGTAAALDFTVGATGGKVAELDPVEVWRRRRGAPAPGPTAAVRKGPPPAPTVPTAAALMKLPQQ